MGSHGRRGGRSHGRQSGQASGGARSPGAEPECAAARIEASVTSGTTEGKATHANRPRVAARFTGAAYSWCKALPSAFGGGLGRRVLNAYGLGARNISSISTWYPLARRLVSFAMPTTAINSPSILSVMPCRRAEAVWEAMQ